MTNIQVAISTANGLHFYDEITVSEDYTMNEVIKAIKNRCEDAKSFRLVDSMKGYAEVR